MLLCTATATSSPFATEMLGGVTDFVCLVFQTLLQQDIFIIFKLLTVLSAVLGHFFYFRYPQLYRQTQANEAMWIAKEQVGDESLDFVTVPPPSPHQAPSGQRRSSRIRAMFGGGIPTPAATVGFGADATVRDKVEERKLDAGQVGTPKGVGGVGTGFSGTFCRAGGGGDVSPGTSTPPTMRTSGPVVSLSGEPLRVYRPGQSSQASLLHPAKEGSGGSSGTPGGS